MQASRFKALYLALASLLAAGIPASAEDGVSATKIVFGQATALEGPASALGRGMKAGLEAAFAEINKASNVSRATLYNWKKRKTKRPQHCTLAAVAGACGKAFALVDKPKGMPSGRSVL